MTGRATRAERMAMPLARQVIQDLAVEHGACIRPVQMRRTSFDTGQAETVLVPCGHTLAHVCPSCAERARTLRAAQCREGWHLEDEPDIESDPATDDQKFWIEKRRGAAAPRPIRRIQGRTRPISMSSSPSLMRRSPRRACAGRRPRISPRGGIVRPGAARMPRIFPSGGKSAQGRQDLRRAGRQDLPPVPIPHAYVSQLWPGRRIRYATRPVHLRL